MSVRVARYVAAAAVLASVYVVVGRIGLMMDAVGGFATLVWPPAGIALAALLLWGRVLWPGVAAGALIVNLLAGAPVAVAIGIAAGNTLEAVLAVTLMCRVPAFTTSLMRVRDVLALIVAGAFSTTVAATVGTASLLLGGVIAAERIGVTWITWWLGDTVGVFVFGPLLLTWATDRPAVRSDLPLLPAAAHAAPHAPSRSWLEVVLLGIAVVAASAWIFGGRPPAAVSFLEPYVLFPLLIWAALRFHQRGAATVILIVSSIAIGFTAAAVGPFADGTLQERLRPLQVFLALSAVTFLVLGAIAAERAATERALMRAKEAAEAASLAKSRFLAVMSHELRTPLTGILGYADLLHSGVIDPVTEKQRQHLSRVMTAAWHLVSVIEGILTFSRAEAGREEVRIEGTDATAIAREVMTILEPQASAKDLELRLRAPHDPLHMRTDAGKLRQILINLIGNAVKFTANGAVELDVRGSDGLVVFRVSDEGPGIAEDRLTHIFEPFTQVDDAATRTAGGTGLGLAITATLARLLGGDIGVESAPGRGSTFTVWLPAEPPGADAAARERERNEMYQDDHDVANRTG